MNYVERIGSQFSQDLSQKKKEEGEKHIWQALVEVKSNLVQHLSNMDIKDDLLIRFDQIYPEIVKQEQLRKSKKEQGLTLMPQSLPH